MVETAGKQQPGSRWRGWRLGLAVICFGFLSNQPMAAQQASEYQVKAAYLYQFLNFVTWPQSALPAPDASFEICVLGNDPFGPDLDNTVQGKLVRGRSIRVQRLGSPSSARRCHILFVASSERTRLGLILQAVAGLPTLTVSELRDFETQGGMVRLVVEHENVRLRINPDAAAAAGLQISSKLLSVSAVVRGRSGS